ncbi:hypothetical protein GCM10028805_54670 [Spirosoma harenae]
MKQISPLWLIFLALQWSNVLAQSDTPINKDVPIDGFYITQLRNVCEGEIYTIQCTYGAINPSNNFGIKTQPDCSIRPTTSEPNGSLKWEGDGMIVDDYGIYPNGVYWAKVRFFASGKYRLKWTTYEDFIGWEERTCGRPPTPSSKINYHYACEVPEEVTFIPKPPKPTLNASPSQVTEVYKDVIFSVEGCPVSTPELPVTYQFARATSCDGNNLEYVEDYNFYSEKTRRTFFDTPTKIYIKARCKVGGCIGEYSEPISIRVIEKPSVPPPNCGLGEVDEDGYFPGRKDFHRYALAKEICNKSTDPDCTVENVFNLLKSQQKNSVPQYEDFPRQYLGYFVNGPLISSVLDVYYIIAPTQDCHQTGVYSPASGYFLVKGLDPPCLDCFSTSNLGFFWDPITQKIDNSSHTVSNYTLPGHVLHPGKIMTTIKEDECTIYGQVIGMGNSKMFDCCQLLGEYLSKTENVKQGLYAFDKLLNRLKQLYDSKSWK